MRQRGKTTITVAAFLQEIIQKRPELITTSEVHHMRNLEIFGTSVLVETKHAKKIYGTSPAEKILVIDECKSIKS